MKATLFYAIVILASASSAALGEQNLDQIQKLGAQVSILAPGLLESVRAAYPATGAN